MEKNPPGWLPPWFRCEVCGRDRSGHDRLNRLVAMPDRHEWLTALRAGRARAHQAANQRLPIDKE